MDDKNLNLKPTGVVIWYTPHNHMVHGRFNIPQPQRPDVSQVGYDGSLQLHENQTVEEGIHLMTCILKRRVNSDLSDNSTWNMTKWGGSCNEEWISVLGDKVNK